jgi:CheY-like chemotaxis protein
LSQTKFSAPILVVEDNEANRILAIRLLEKLGYSAVAVRDGREAVHATADGGYPLVLMDCHMPGMDGFEATRAIRAREAGRHERLPVIAMTASVTKPDREACLDAGMDDIVTKPVMIDVLSQVLGRWYPGASHSPAVRSLRAVGDPDGLDVDVLRRLGDDLGPEAFARFLDSYMRELPLRQAAILRAIDDHSTEALRMAAHVLKSPSAAVGASALAGVCSELETLARDGSTEAASPVVNRLLAECRAVVDALQAKRARLRT